MELPYGLSSGTPAAELMDSTAAKLWLRVDTSADDTIVAALIKAARQVIESQCNLTCTTTTHTLTLDCFPSTWIYLPRGPLQSVTSVKYYDSDGTQQTWASTNYIVDTKTPSPRIGRADGISWPIYDTRIAPIEVVYVAGYGNAATDVPDALIVAAKMIVADMYENRQTGAEREIFMNPTVDHLLSLYKNRNPVLGA